METADECYNAFLAIEQENISRLKTKENENRFISETIDFFKSQQTMTNFTTATTTTDHKCKVSINDLDSLSDETLQMIKHNKINEMIKRINESEFIPKQCTLNVIDGKMVTGNRNLSRNKNAITINKDYAKVFENSSSNDDGNSNNNGLNALMMMTDSSSAENARSVYGYIVYEILYSMENEQERKQIILQYQKRYGINSGHNNTIAALNCFSVLKELKSICKPIDTKILSSTSDLSVLDEGGYGKIVVQMKIPLIKFCNFIKLESTVLCTTEYQREHLCIKVISQDEDSPVTFRVDSTQMIINHKQMYFNKVTKEYERGLCFQPEYHHAKNLKTVWKFDNIFICKETGTVHTCGFRCDRMVRSIDYNMICPLTGVIIDDYVIDSKEFKSYVSPTEYKDNQVRYMKDIQIVLNGAYSAAIEEKEKKKIELLTMKKEQEMNNHNNNIIKTDSNETMLPMSSPTLPILKKKKIKSIAKSAPVVSTTHHKRKKNPEYLIPNSITNIKLIEIHKEQKTVNEIIDNPHQYTRNMDFIKNKRQRPSMMNYSPTSYIKSDGTIDPILYLEHKMQRKSHDMKKSCLAFALKIILNLFSNERFELEEIKNLDVEQMIIRNWQMYEKKCATNDVFTCATDYLVMAENTRNSNPSFMKFNFTIDSRVQLALSYARKVLSLWYILRKNTRMIEDSATTTVTGITHYYFSNFVISAMLMFQNGCVISIMDDLDYDRMKANAENISKKRVITTTIDDEISSDADDDDDSDISELDSISKSKIKIKKTKKKKSPVIPIIKKKKKKRYTKDDGSIFSPYSTSIETSMSPPPPPILQPSTTVESNNTLSTINNHNNSIILYPPSLLSSSIIVSDILNPSKIQTVVIIKKDELLQNGCLSISNDYIKITKKKKSITRNDPIVEITKQIEHYIQETVQLKLVSYEAFKLEYVDYETIEQKWFMDINAKIVD